MADLAKSDVFFVITTAAVIVITVIVAVLLAYLFIIIRDVKEVVRKVKEESGEVIEDVKELRHRLREQGSALGRASAVARFFKSAFLGKRSRTKKSKAKDEASEE